MGEGHPACSPPRLPFSPQGAAGAGGWAALSTEDCSGLSLGLSFPCVLWGLQGSSRDWATCPERRFPEFRRVSLTPG